MPETSKARRARKPLTDEMFAEMCELIAGGMSLRKVCAQPQFVSHTTFLEALRASEARAAHYARARETMLKAEAERILEIAEEKPKDQVEAAWQKTRIDARKWILSRLLPKEYGDRVGVDHQGGVSISVVTGVPAAGESPSSS